MRHQVFRHRLRRRSAKFDGNGLDLYGGLGGTLMKVCSDNDTSTIHIHRPHMISVPGGGGGETHNEVRQTEPPEG